MSTSSFRQTVGSAEGPQEPRAFTSAGDPRATNACDTHAGSETTQYISDQKKRRAKGM